MVIATDSIFFSLTYIFLYYPDYTRNCNNSHLIIINHIQLKTHIQPSNAFLIRGHASKGYWLNNFIISIPLLAKKKQVKKNLLSCHWHHHSNCKFQEPTKSSHKHKKKLSTQSVYRHERTRRVSAEDCWLGLLSFSLCWISPAGATCRLSILLQQQLLYVRRYSRKTRNENDDRRESRLFVWKKRTILMSWFVKCLLIYRLVVKVSLGFTCI